MRTNAERWLVAVACWALAAMGAANLWWTLMTGGFDETKDLVTGVLLIGIGLDLPRLKPGDDA